MAGAAHANSPVVIPGVDGLAAHLGTEIGVSPWTSIGQSQIQRFAEVTGDHQWIHVDVERASKESPFGGPIAHGYLVLSLLPSLAWQVLTVQGPRLAVNYGLDRVRFLTPVSADRRVRLRVTLAELREAPMGTLATYENTFELEGAEKPACIARSLTLYV